MTGAIEYAALFIDAMDIAGNPKIAAAVDRLSVIEAESDDLEDDDPLEDDE